MLNATFERYWTEFRARASGRKAYKDYTPYETRVIGSFVRLGWRDRIDGLIDFFMEDRRPAGWNQWAEVVGRDPREVRFIGDMPHAWVASDFVRGALDMFAWDRRDDRALVLGGGLSRDWLAGPGLVDPRAGDALRQPRFRDARTPQRLSATIGGSARPPGGFVLAWPFAGTPPVARVNGRPVAWRNGALTIPATGQPIAIEVGHDRARRRRLGRRAAPPAALVEGQHPHAALTADGYAFQLHLPPGAAARKPPRAIR